MTQKKLNTILELHKKWLNNEPDGVCADLRYIALKGANLQDANLQGANLQETNLQGAYLQGAYLRYANLQGANLQETNLQGANLQGAYLRYANLQGAILYGANLDFASWPLRCGSLLAHIDDRIGIQLAAHLVSAALVSPHTSQEFKDDVKVLQKWTKKFHRTDIPSVVKEYLGMEVDDYEPSRA